MYNIFLLYYYTIIYVYILLYSVMLSFNCYNIIVIIINYLYCEHY